MIDYSSFYKNIVKTSKNRITMIIRLNLSKKDIIRLKRILNNGVINKDPNISSQMHYYDKKFCEALYNVLDFNLEEEFSLKNLKKKYNGCIFY